MYTVHQRHKIAVIVYLKDESISPKPANAANHKTQAPNYK